ncbi:hypothetical protein pb186bvf_009789 [Paramecium bursaria]
MQKVQKNCKRQVNIPGNFSGNQQLYIRGYAVNIINYFQFIIFVKIKQEHNKITKAMLILFIVLFDINQPISNNQWWYQIENNSYKVKY